MIKGKIELINNNLSNFEKLLFELELNSFGIENIDFKNSEIEYQNEQQKIKIISNSSYISKIDTIETNYYYLTRKVYRGNSSSYLTHWFYYYKGKFFPRMIRAIFNIIGIEKGNNVFDPFLGSGTSALESQLLGLNFKGTDISPICKLITDVKTQSIYCINEIISIKSKLSTLESNTVNKKVLYESFLNRETANLNVLNFYNLVRLNSLRNRNPSLNIINRFNYFLNQMIDFLLYFKKSKELLNLSLGTVETLISDSRNIECGIDVFDGIITSPPYFNAIDYMKNDNEYYQETNINTDNIKNNFIGLRNGGIDEYLNDIKTICLKFYRLLKKDKFAVLIIGNNFKKGKSVKNVSYWIELMQSVGFSLNINIPTDKYTKNTSIFRENILFFKK